MQRRVSEIVTTFKATGLGAVQAALKAVAKAVAAAREAMAKMGTAAAEKLQAMREKAARAAAAIRDLGTKAKETLTKIASAAAPAAKAIADMGVKATAAGLAIAALAKASAFGFIAAAVQSTVEDLTQLRQMAALLRLPPEWVSYWQQIGLQSGIAKEDMSAVLTAFNAAAAEAASDPESGFATVFKEMGVEVKDAEGNLRNMSHVFSEFIYAQEKLSASKRGFFMNQIFGGDAAKISEFFKTYNQKSADQHNAQFRALKANGQLVTNEQVERVKRYEAQVKRLSEAYLAVQRAVFEKVEPYLSLFFNRLGSRTQDSARGVGDYFGRFVRNIANILNAASVAFLEIDALGHDATGQWIFSDRAYEIFESIRKLLEAVYAVAELAAKALYVVAKAANAAFKSMTGIDVVDWARSFSIDDLQKIFVRVVNFVSGTIQKVVAYFYSLGRDVKRIFEGTFEADEMETLLGRWGSAGAKVVVGIFKKIGAAVTAEIDKVKAYFATAMKEFELADAAGTGTKGMTTVLGKVLIQLDDIAESISHVFNQFRKVFVLGVEADPGFEWLEDVHQVLDGLIGSMKTFMDIMGSLLSPLQAVISAFGGWDAAGVVLATVTLAGLIAKVRSLLVWTGLLSGAGTVAATAMGGGAAVAGAGAAAGAVGATVGAGAAAGTGAAAAGGTGLAALLSSLAASIAAVTAALLPLAAMAGAIALGVAGLVALFNSLPDEWKQNINSAANAVTPDFVMDAIGASRTTMNAGLDAAAAANDASLERYGVKPGAMGVYERMYGREEADRMRANQAAYRMLDDAAARSAQQVPTQINIPGLSEPIRASMTRSELADAQSLRMTRTSY